MSLAVVIHAPHDLRVDTIAAPEPLGPDEVEVRVGAGGICGSDLHYFHDGGFGAVRLKEPMILGHEIAGTVAAVGDKVSAVRPGDRVAVDPSRACGRCRYCAENLANQCLDMRFFGSAMRFPHVQGGFRQALVAQARQCVPVPADLPLAMAAFAEPLAVCLHAVSRAGSLAGKRVLVTGAGPIGVLTLLAARDAGAAEVVITDVADAPLALAAKVGADQAINVAQDADAMARFMPDKAFFDVMFEASGNPAALRQGIEVVRPRGIVVLIGVGGEASLMLNVLVAKEVELRGTFRFDREFAQAVAAISSGRIDPAPLLTETVPLREAPRAFALASDRSRAMKVQLAFA
ncbi:MAG: L-idonate 5-dehydrogenase [uncultured Microvirga sp.]|uniref:L-idonate 5-dehydrogenase n=1 Tax=uncultured Microvirga sp. TaxID=412392 RepID=A0A6J4LC62_9HYPH|nr:MAG: L-idonate 5-dehydrogenase [uncultured Microvirga sp.]